MMIKVLQVFAEPLSFGGQESAIMNFYRKIDKQKYQFDFFTPYYSDNLDMLSEIEKEGGRYFVCNKSFHSKMRKIHFITELDRFLKKNKYDVVHINSGSTFALAHGARICKRNNIKKVITHSHVAGKQGIKHVFVKKYYDSFFSKYSSYCIACSGEALKWKYSRRIINQSNSKVIYNGIDVDKFEFDIETRNNLRNRFDLNNDVVVGFVGRLTHQKNPLFVIDIFNDYYKENNKSKLLLIGDGEKKSKVKDRIKTYNIENSVIWLEKRNDINELMMLMDCFIMPSFYEGLPIVLVEAQASGLKCLCSDTVSKETAITNNIHFLPISDTSYWVNELKKTEPHNRKDAYNILKGSKFDIDVCVKELEELYNK